jgi:hypothetical protein
MKRKLPNGAKLARRLSPRVEAMGRETSTKGTTMFATLLRALTFAWALGLGAAPGYAAEPVKAHKVAIHVDRDDAAIMNMALNNAKNVMEYYQGKGEPVQVEIVAYGPGLNMLRADKSPVPDRVKQMSPKVRFSACNNTKMAMEKREGHAITLLPQAVIVPAGVVRLMELQEQGYTYVKP